MIRAVLLFLSIGLLAACDSQSAERRDTVFDDPRMNAVLFDPIMVDPDLTQQNRKTVVVEPGGLVDTAMPGPLPGGHGEQR